MLLERDPKTPRKRDKKVIKLVNRLVFLSKNDTFRETWDRMAELELENACEPCKGKNALVELKEQELFILCYVLCIRLRPCNAPLFCNQILGLFVQIRCFVRFYLKIFLKAF
jgi:hypothetical protein